ncbi:unnamed protein product, partial [Laminaria digitata]
GGRERVVLPRPDEEYEEALARLTAAAAHAAELYRELAEASALSAATGGTGAGTAIGLGTGRKGAGAESFPSMMLAKLSSGSPAFREAGRGAVVAGESHGGAAVANATPGEKNEEEDDDDDDYEDDYDWEGEGEDGEVA